MKRLSMREALRRCRKAGFDVVHKQKSGLVKITHQGDSITVSSRKKDVTRNMQ